MHPGAGGMADRGTSWLIGGSSLFFLNLNNLVIIIMGKKDKKKYQKKGKTHY